MGAKMPEREEGIGCGHECADDGTELTPECGVSICEAYDDYEEGM